MRDLVNFPTRRVRALKCVAVGQPCSLHDGDAATALPSQAILQIFTLHELVREATLRKVEVKAV